MWGGSRGSSSVEVNDCGDRYQIVVIRERRRREDQVR